MSTEWQWLFIKENWYLDSYLLIGQSINTEVPYIPQYPLSEWVIIAKHQLSIFSAISWQEQVTSGSDDDDVSFVIDQHAELDFSSASSLKQQTG